MPVQQRLWPQQKGAPATPRQHSAQRRKRKAIRRFEPRLVDLAAKDRQLVPGHEDLQLLRSLAPAKKND
jgi:hypothetical protein